MIHNHQTGPISLEHPKQGSTLPITKDILQNHNGTHPSQRQETNIQSLVRIFDSKSLFESPIVINERKQASMNGHSAPKQETNIFSHASLSSKKELVNGKITSANSTEKTSYSSFPNGKQGNNAENAGSGVSGPKGTQAESKEISYDRQKESDSTQEVVQSTSKRGSRRQPLPEEEKDLSSKQQENFKGQLIQSQKLIQNERHLQKNDQNAATTRENGLHTSTGVMKKDPVKVPSYFHDIDDEDDEIPEPSTRQQEKPNLNQKTDSTAKPVQNQTTNPRQAENSGNNSNSNPPHSTQKKDPFDPSETKIETKNSMSNSKIESKPQSNGAPKKTASSEEQANSKQVSFAKYLFSLDNFPTSTTDTEDSYTFFKRSIARNIMEESTLDDDLDTEPDFGSKRLIRWRVRGILPHLRAFDLYNSLTAKGFQVIRVKINIQSEKRTNRLKSDDPLYDLLHGNNRALQIENGYHNFSNDSFFNEIFESGPMFSHQTTKRTKNLKEILQTRLELSKIDVQDEDLIACNELEKLIEKVQLCHNLNEKIKSKDKVYGDSDESRYFSRLDEDDDDDEIYQLKRQLVDLYDADIEPNFLKKMKKTEEKKPNMGEVLLWGTLAENINKSNEKIVFRDNIQNQTHIYVDFDKLSLLESEQYNTVKAKLEKTTMIFTDCKFGTFIHEGKEKKLFRSYFTVSDAMQAQQVNARRIKNGKLFTFYSEDKKRSKKMEVMFDIASDNLQFKFEFNYKHCDVVHIEDLEDEVRIYFNLMVPPRFYAYFHEAKEYLDFLLNEKWERIDYFIVKKILGRGKEDEIDELERIYLTRNTVVMLSFNKREENARKGLKKLKEYFEKVNIQLIEKSQRYFQHINFYHLRPKLTYKEIARYPEERLPFEIKYAILALASQRRFDLFQLDGKFLQRLVNLNGKNAFEITQKTLNDLVSQNCFDEVVKKLSEGGQEVIFENIFREKWKDNENYYDLWKMTRKLDYMSYTKRVVITPSSVVFHCEEPELSNTVLRLYEDQIHNFLRVSFSDEMQEGTKKMRYVTIKRFKEYLKGLKVFDKTFRVLAFSASQLRTDSLWMFADNPQLNCDKIRRSLGSFSNIKIPAKYAARVGQLFSSSFQVLNTKAQQVSIVEIDDIVVKETGALFSDGIGVISNDLMDAIRLERGISADFSAIQVRMGGIKGVLARAGPWSDRKKTIWIRPSMKKFQGNETYLEMLDYCKHRHGYLNRQVLVLLMTLGINDEEIMQLQEEYIEKLKELSYRDASLFNYLNNEQQSPVNEILRDCFNAGIFVKEEPFINGIVQTIKIRSFLNLKAKSNILVPKSARLMGVLDEFGILEYGEIYMKMQTEADKYGINTQPTTTSLPDGTKVMVTRNPCLHPGDIRVLTVRSGPKYDKKLGHLINCVVFPQKGPRPHTTEISGSDLDGDLFFVTWDARLIPAEVDEPMEYDTEKKGLSPKEDVTVDKIIDFFIEYMNSATLGQIDNSHLALADSRPRKARDPACLQLAYAHSVAVDFVKSGIKPSTRSLARATVWPDFMEKKSDTHEVLPSTTLLGRLYRQTKHHMKQNGITELSKERKINEIRLKIDEDLIYGDWEKYISQAAQALYQYHNDMYSVIALYGLQSEFEVYSGNFLALQKIDGKKQNLEKLQTKILNHVMVLKERYSDLFNSKGLSEEDLMSKASAIYILSYYNSDVPCSISDKLLKYMQTDRELKKLNQLFENRADNTRYIGLPWFVARDQIIAIKKKSLPKQKSQ
mgnify:FL=1